MRAKPRTKTQRVEHYLPTSLLENPVRLTVVGCGGTGSAVAAGLPYLHQAMLAWGHPHGPDVTLVDGDKISRTNCIRQPFSESEVGLYKALAPQADILSDRRTKKSDPTGWLFVKEFSPKHPILSVTNSRVADIYE